MTPNNLAYAVAEAEEKIRPFSPFDWFTGNQWLVIAILGYLVLTVFWGIILVKWAGPYDERSSDDPPPILGELVFAFLSLVAVGLVLGAIHWLCWLWVTP